MFATSHSFLNYFSLIFKKGTVQWLNCTYLKYELNCSYNGGGVVYLRKSKASWLTLQYCANCYDMLINMTANNEYNRLILNRVRHGGEDNTGRSWLRGKGDPVLLESVDNKNMVRNLWFSQKYLPKVFLKCIPAVWVCILVLIRLKIELMVMNERKTFLNSMTLRLMKKRRLNTLC